MKYSDAGRSLADAMGVDVSDEQLVVSIDIRIRPDELPVVTVTRLISVDSEMIERVERLLLSSAVVPR